MKTPHKHAELIKAWADGAEIEEQHLKKDWAPFTDGHWMESDSWNYRIKPEPKPDVVHIWYAEPDSYPRFKDYGPYNLKLTFDGETGKLKSAEVL
jgi:hypothetical protein